MSVCELLCVQLEILEEKKRSGSGSTKRYWLESDCWKLNLGPTTNLVISDKMLNLFRSWVFHL